MEQYELIQQCVQCLEREWESVKWVTGLVSVSIGLLLLAAWLALRGPRY